MRLLDRYYSMIVAGLPPDVPPRIHTLAADEAGAYFFQVEAPCPWALTRDFGCVLPLFGADWIDFRVPDEGCGEGDVWDGSADADMVGCLHWAEALPARPAAQQAALRRDVILDRVTARLAGWDSSDLPHDLAAKRQDAVAAALAGGWLPRSLNVWQLYMRAGASVFIRYAEIWAYVDRTGRMLPNLLFTVNWDEHFPYDLTLKSLVPFLFITDRLHNRDPRLRLEASVMRVAADAIDAPISAPDAKRRQCARHTRRGHLRDYSANGLFGKHRQRVWQPASERGHLGRGRIVKDYTVRVTVEEQAWAQPEPVLSV